MKKNGFTLVELLAVIVILALILAIAIPSISSVLDSAKQNAYDAQSKLILNAAQKYASLVAGLPTTNTQKIITLKDLQDNNYISTNITDPRTGRVIPNSTWIIINNSSGTYTYNVGYATDGLILQYDSIYNGGFGIHNDNASVNKGTWKDLSGNNNDGTLTNYLYDATSGWTSSSLKSASGTTGRVLQSTSFSGLQSFTVEVFGIFNENIGSSTYPRILSTNGTYTTVYEGVNGADFSCASTTPTNTLLGRVSNGVVGNATSVSGVGNMGLMSLVYQWDYSTKKMSIYRDGLKLKEYTITLYDNVNFDKLGLAHGRSVNSGEFYYYIARAYNRALLPNEISNNYNVDKLRYGY